MKLWGYWKIFQFCIVYDEPNETDIIVVWGFIRVRITGRLANRTRWRWMWGQAW